MSERLIYNITIPKIMDLGFSIVSDILFITKHKNDHNFGPNLNIDKILSVIDSPGHPPSIVQTRDQNSRLFLNRTLGSFCA